MKNTDKGRLAGNAIFASYGTIPTLQHLRLFLFTK